MQALFSLFNSRCLAPLALSLSVLMVGCGGGGGGGGGNGLTRLKLEDADIYGAFVQDANSVIAVSLANGIYEFRDRNGVAVVPKLPVTIKSQNWIVDGKVDVINLNNTWYSTKAGSDNKPLTFQDLDKDGKFTPNVDIPYNGGFTLNYSASGSSLIYANPVAALIPAGWNGVSPIAGLSNDILIAASSTGVKASNNADLNKATALLVAISEALVLTGKNADGLFSAIASANVPVNLLVPGQSQLSAVVNALYAGTAVFVQNLQGLTASLTNPEALAKVVQDAIANNPLTDLGNLTAAVTAADSGISQAITNASSGNPLAAQIAKLRIVPFCELPNAGCNPGSFDEWKVFGQLTNFSINLNSDSGVMTLTGAGNRWLGWFGAATIDLPYFTSSSVSNGQPSWSKTYGSTSIEVLIGMPVLLPGDVSPTVGNFLKICSALNTCMPYFLAEPPDVCNLVASVPAPATPSQLLLQINPLQAANRQVVCTP
jgi:hypothetical protein